MATSVLVRANFAPLKNLKLSTRELMREVGLLARERIIRRTVSGKNEFGTAFRPYSPGYALQKLQETGSAQVNLQLSGAMLNAITITNVTDDSVELGFAG
jgi:hypothetical protein